MIIRNWHRSVYGLFGNSASLHEAVNDLKRASFEEKDVFFLLSHASDGGGFAHVRGSKAPEVALLGAVTGGISGAIIGWGLGAEALNAAIPVMFALAGIGLFGMLFAATGALIGLAFPEYRAKRFQGALKNGGILIAVHVEDGFRKKKAKEILKRTGAGFISVGTESLGGLKWVKEKQRSLRLVKNEVG
jgi:hypothetical protein